MTPFSNRRNKLAIHAKQVTVGTPKNVAFLRDLWSQIASECCLSQPSKEVQAAIKNQRMQLKKRGKKLQKKYVQKPRRRLEQTQSVVPRHMKFWSLTYEWQLVCLDEKDQMLDQEIAEFERAMARNKKRKRATDDIQVVAESSTETS